MYVKSLSIYVNLIRSLFISSLFLFAPTNASAIRVVSPTAGIDITTSRVSHITGEIKTSTYMRFAMEMLTTLQYPGPRVVLIDSTGGDVDSGERIIALLQEERTHGVKQICVVDRVANSMAFDLLTLACDVRLSVPKAYFVAHVIAASGIVCESARRCTPKHLMEIVKHLQEADAPYRKANAKALGLTLAEYDVYADQDHVWRAEVLLKRKYLHGIATVVK